MTPRVIVEPARLAGLSLLRGQSDERLVDLSRAGNERAFEAIVERYSRPLLGYCARLLPSARTEDVVQQAFLNAYAGLHRDDRRIELRPWLYRIAHNAALNAQRDAMILRELEGRSYAQFAIELDATGGAVRQLLSRARNTLRIRACATAPPG